MSAVYERVRAALVGTPLEADLDHLNAELHLTPDSPEWTIAALAVIGGAPLRDEISRTTDAIVQVIDTLDVAIRSAGAEIIKGLAADIREEVIAGVRSDIKGSLVAFLEKFAEFLDEMVRDQQQSTLQATNQARETALAARDVSRTIEKHSRDAFARVSGWTPMRYALVALGALVVLAAWVTGFATRDAIVAGHLIGGCHADVATVAHHLGLSARAAGYARTTICPGG